MKIAEISYDKRLIDYIAASIDTGFEANNYECDYIKKKLNLEYTWKNYLIEINKIFNFKDKFI